MKKILSILLILILATTSLLAVEGAEDEPQDLNPITNSSLSALIDGSYPHSAKSLGMGNAGIAVGGRSDSFYMNPALLARRTLISIPYAQVTLYHPYDLVRQDENGNSIITDLMDVIESGEMEQAVGPATEFLQTIKEGKGKLAEVEAGLTLGGGGFALGLHVKDTIHTFGEIENSKFKANLFDELNVNVLAALGLRFDITPSISIDVGVSGGLSVLGYTGLIGTSDVIDMMGGSNASTGEDPTLALMKTPLALGYYIPLNVGINVNLPWGFSVGAVGRNLLGSAVGIKMQTTDIESVKNDPMAAASGIFTETEDFTIKMDPTFDIGLGWKFENGLFAPTIAADIVDVVGLAESDMSARSFIEHLRAGAEVRILSILDVRGGLNQGYWTIGAGIDLWAIKIDAAYYWQEFGDTIGDYGLDAFTIRFNIGFDR